MSEDIENLENGIQQLSFLSSAISQCLGSMDKNVSKLQTSFTETSAELEELRKLVLKNNELLQSLESDVVDSRTQIESVTRNAAMVEQFVNAQIADAMANMQKELLIQRTGTKMDMSSMRTQLTKTLNDAVSKFSSAKTTPLPQIAAISNSSLAVPGETINAIVERLYRLENSMVMQENINELISASLRSDSYVEEMHEKLQEMEHRFKELEAENTRLRTLVNMASGIGPIDTSSFHDVDVKSQLKSMLHFIDRREKRQWNTFHVQGSENDEGIIGLPDLSLKPPTPVLSHLETLEESDEEMSLEGSVNSHHSQASQHSQHSLSSQPSQGSQASHSSLSSPSKNSGKAKKSHVSWGDLEDEEGNAVDNNDENKEETVSSDSSVKSQSIKKADEGHGISNAMMDGSTPTKLEVEVPVEPEYIDNFIDAYTVEESDEMFHRITQLERQLENWSSLPLTLQKLFDISEELKGEMLAMNNRVLNARMEASDESLHPDKVLLRKIAGCRDLWQQIKEDLQYGLEILADEEAEREELNFQRKLQTIGDDAGMENADLGSEFSDELMGGWNTGEMSSENIVDKTNNSKLEDNFIPRIKMFFDYLTASMASFEPRNNSGVDTALALFPVLDQLTLKAEELLIMDEEAKNSGRLCHGFDDIHCMDRTNSLRYRLANACKTSFPILDENVEKITLRRRVEKLELALPKKSEKLAVLEMEQELRRALATKAEQEDMIQMASKKASLVEVQKLKDQLFRQIDLLKGHINVPLMSEESFSPNVSQKSAKEVQDLTSRFDLLLKHFQDLQGFCNAFVPRDEVHEALQAVLGEVKTIRGTSVTFNTFKEAMKMKADSDEVKKLISTLTLAIGNVNGKSEGSVVHAKCLVCDKPVTHMASTNSSPPRSTSMYYSKSTGQLPPITNDDPSEEGSFKGRPESNNTIGSNRLPSSTFVRMASKDTTTSAREKSKVSTDIAVMKSTLDLPSLSESSIPQSAHYKQRIRSSAGGGMGPGFVPDTR